MYNSTEVTPEQQQQNEHFDDTVSEMNSLHTYLTYRRQFSKTWTDYCNETVENLLDMEGIPYVINPM